MRISDWSSDVCSSDLHGLPDRFPACAAPSQIFIPSPDPQCRQKTLIRSEEHTSELQSLMRISYAVFCLKKKKNKDRILQNNRRKHTTRTTMTIHNNTVIIGQEN